MFENNNNFVNNSNVQNTIKGKFNKSESIWRFSYSGKYNFRKFQLIINYINRTHQFPVMQP